MARYLIVEDNLIKENIEAKNVKDALRQSDTRPGDVVQVYRIASGPVDVKVASETTMTYDFGDDPDSAPDSD